MWSCIVKEPDAGIAVTIDNTCKSSVLKREEYLLEDGKTKPRSDL